MLQIENEYETTIESIYYQNNYNNLQNPDNVQEILDYTEQDFKGSSSTNNIYINASNKIQLPKEKNWTIPLLLESPKSKKFQSPDHEIGFLRDSREVSNFINIPTWNELQPLHPILLHVKISSKLATAQRSSLT